MFRGQLYDFQQQAADQLLEWNGGLLSLSMGLGKTPVSIYIAETLLDAEQAEIALVVVPPNLRRQWQNEIKKFAPDATVTLVEGPPKKRAEQYGWAYERAEYLIVGYPALLNDWEHLTDFPTDLVIADECQAVKNFRAKRTKKLKKLGGDFRLGLTGHPLENRPEDIYSIVEWVDPSLLGRFDLFDRTYIVRDDWGRPVRYRNLDHLAARLRGSVMVRSSRADVADQLPERVEQDLDIDLDPATDRVYRWVVDDLLGWLDRAAESGGSGFDLDAAYGRTDAEDDSWHIRGSIAARMLALRMLCDHPRLIEHSADKFVSTLGDHGSEYLLSLRESVDLAKLKTPKFDATIDLIRTIS
jgi:SNF2 family DNA or RNA helicase